MSDHTIDPDRCKAGQPTEPTRCTWHKPHHWCDDCRGWYGVPHDFDHAEHMRGPGKEGCACRGHQQQAELVAELEHLESYHYPQVFAQFGGYAARHVMTVLHDEGLYRHLRFHTPGGGGIGRFDLITFPGSLVIRGDIGDGWLFTREDDMLPWFNDGSDKHGRINPGYWWEKMPEAQRRAAKGYSGQAFRRYVAQLVTQAVERMGYDPDPDPDDLDHVTAVAMVGEYHRVHRQLTEAVEDEILTFADSEDMALTALRDFTFEVTHGCGDQRDTEDVSLVGDIYDAHASSVDFDHHFLLACHAIHWGAGRYAREVRMPRLGKAPA